jgi:DNA invertase Pin-like site-specific DNA recombinase
MHELVNALEEFRTLGIDLISYRENADTTAAQGKHMGRPRIPPQKAAAIRRDLLAGHSLRSTIKAHGVGPKTVQRIKAALAEQTS